MCTDLMIYSAEKLRACKNSKPLLRVTTTLKVQQCSLIFPRTNQNFAIKKDSLASSDLDTGSPNLDSVGFTKPHKQKKTAIMQSICLPSRSSGSLLQATKLKSKGQRIME
jgi:hypothetical protein